MVIHGSDFDIAFFPNLSTDGFFKGLPRLEEPSETRVQARRETVLSSKQSLGSIFRKNRYNDDRISMVNLSDARPTNLFEGKRNYEFLWMRCIEVV